MGNHGRTGGDDESSDDRERYCANWAVGQTDTISSTIVGVVAEAEGTAPTALPRPLQEAVNVDALVGVLDSGAGRGATEVSFRYDRWVVTANDSGDVVVEPAEE